MTIQDVTQIFSSFIQCFSTIIIAIGLIFGYIQLKKLNEQVDEAKRARSTTALLDLIKFLQAENVRKAREVVLRELKDIPFKEWDDAQKRNAAVVCSTYDIAGILIREGLVPKKPVLESWGPSIVNCFKILYPYIEDLQKPENSGPTYWDDFVWIYNEINRKLFR